MKADYQKLIIYYFSGTGNAKRASEWIIDIAKEHELEAELINIDSTPKSRLAGNPIKSENVLVCISAY